MVRHESRGMELPIDCLAALIHFVTRNPRFGFQRAIAGTGLPFRIGIMVLFDKVASVQVTTMEYSPFVFTGIS